MAGENGSAVVTENEDFQVRIDELVSSALKDQAREKRVLMETVHGAKAALVKAEEELTTLRRMLESRDRAVLDLLEAKLSGVGTEASIGFVADRVEEVLSRDTASRAVAPLVEEIRRLEQSMQGLTDSVEQIDVASPTQSLREAIEKRFSEMVQRSEQSSESTAEIAREIGAFSSMIKKIDDIAPAVEHRLTSMEEALAGDIDVAQESLVRDIRTAISESSERASTEFGSRLSEVISQAASEISDSVTSSHNQLRESMLEATSRIRESVAAFKDMVTESSSESSSRTLEEIQDGFQAFQEHLSKIAGDFESSLNNQEERVDGFVSALSEELRSIPEKIQEQLDEARAGQEIRNSTVAKHVESIRQVVTGAESTRDEAFRRRLDELTQALSEAGDNVGGTVTSSLEPFSEEVRRLGERIRQANRRITESNTRMEAMQESLVAYLAARDEKLERVRDQALINLLDRLGDSLKPRDRARLGDAFRDAQQRRIDKRDAERYRQMMSAPTASEMKAVEEDLQSAQSAPELEVTSTTEAIPAGEMIAEEALVPQVRPTLRPKAKRASPKPAKVAPLKQQKVEEPPKAEVQSLLLTEVEAEMPSIEETPIPKPEAELMKAVKSKTSRTPKSKASAKASPKKKTPARPAKRSL